MSLQVSFSANAKELSAAHQAVISDTDDTNWLIFGYEKGTNDLKVQDTGSGGLEELYDEFSDGKVQYALARVIDPNSQLPKIVFIGWCGSGVPETRKGFFNSHLADVSKFFKSFHVQINARNEADVEPDLIMKRVAESSGANYSVHKEASRPQPAVTPVNSVYKKTEVPDIAAMQRESMKREGPPKPVGTTYQPVQTAPKPLASRWGSATSNQSSGAAAVRAERERAEKEAREREEQAFREREAKGRQQALEQERQHNEQQSQREAEEARSREAEESQRRQRLQQEEEERERQRQLQQEQQEQQDRRAQEEQQERLRQQEQERQRQLAQEEQDRQRQQAEERERQQRQQAEEQERQRQQALAQQEHERQLAEEHARQEAERLRREQEEQQDIAAAATIAAATTATTAAAASIVNESNGVSAVVLFGYDAGESNEMTLVEGEVITEIDQLDEGWWFGVSEDGKKQGLFPANYVQVLEREPDTTQPHVDDSVPVSHVPAAPTPPAAPAPAASAAAPSVEDLGKTAVALYDYEAGEENEISFRENERITHIDFVSEDWWFGTSEVTMKQGLFPANYVELQQ